MFQEFYMICKFHIVHIYIDIYPKTYKEIVEQKMPNTWKYKKKKFIFKSIDLMESLLCRRKNVFTRDYGQILSSFF